MVSGHIGRLANGCGAGLAVTAWEMSINHDLVLGGEGETMSSARDAAVPRSSLPEPGVIFRPQIHECTDD